jgi:hypothetical protein
MAMMAVMGIQFSIRQLLLSTALVAAGFGILRLVWAHRIIAASNSMLPFLGCCVASLMFVMAVALPFKQRLLGVTIGVWFVAFLWLLILVVPRLARA